MQVFLARELFQLLSMKNLSNNNINTKTFLQVSKALLVTLMTVDAWNRRLQSSYLRDQTLSTSSHLPIQASKHFSYRGLS
jgi:hypothetical protein